VSDARDRTDQTGQTESNNPDIWKIWDKAFDYLHQHLFAHFRRSETRCRVRRYLLGLLRSAERKNSWQLAGTMHESGPQGMQRHATLAQFYPVVCKYLSGAYSPLYVCCHSVYL
jgi:hypothetical protein